MLALKLFGKNDIRLIETEIPQIGEREILLKVDAAAVCGTDIRMWQNGHAAASEQNPLTLGHELAGTIEKVGADVAFYQKGMQVALAPNIGCGICDMCVSGRPHLCAEYKAFGINMNGGFAEYAVVPEKAITQGALMLLPNGISPAEAALNEPLSCAYNGFLKCNVSAGEHAMVVGAGPIGLFHAMLLKMAGCVSVIVNDISPERCKQAENLIEGALGYCGDDLAGFVNKTTNGKGLDVAIVACPVPQMQSAMLPLMNYSGRVNCFGGIPQDKQPVSINTNLIHYKELILTGSTRSSTAQFRKTLEFVSQGLLPLNKMITAEYDIKDALKAFEQAKNAVGMKHVIRF